MEFILLADNQNKEFNNASFSEIKEAYLKVFRAKSYSRKNFISIIHVAEEKELEIYPQSIVLIDHLKYYDGPGSPAEILSMRYKEGTILPILEQAIQMFQGGEIEKLISLFKTLPLPDDE